MKKYSKIPRNINYSDKIKEIYFDKNKYDMHDMIKKNMNKNYKQQHKDKNLLYIETKDDLVYEFLNNELQNIFSNKPISNEEIIGNLLKNNIKISKRVLDMFENISSKKINSVIKGYLKKSIVVKKNLKFIYLENKIEEVILVFDYYNLYLQDILTYDLKEIKDDQILTLDKDKIKIVKKDKKELNDLEIFKKQLLYLDSYTYDLKEYKDDIKNNCLNYKLINNSTNVVNLYTENYIYTISNYNVISIKTKDNIPMPTKKIIQNKLLDISNLNNDFDINDSFKCSNYTKDIYGNLIKAKEYIERLGLSIRVLTKFITDVNFQELYMFITSDIIYYGLFLYDDYIENNSIILTNRFLYIIKDNVIIDIKTIKKENIKECSLLFKPIINANTKKDTILKLDIKDKIRNFITYDTILYLKIGSHAEKRFNERISKNNDLQIKEDILKNDIYKNGEVMLGTYYLNSKLVKGKNFVYVLTNNEIVSIWRTNEFIDNLGNRYFKKIKNA